MNTTLTTLTTEPEDTLRSILLTVDGKGRATKEAALDELLRRARRDGANLDYELMQELKRP